MEEIQFFFTKGFNLGNRFASICSRQLCCEASCIEEIVGTPALLIYGIRADSCTGWCLLVPVCKEIGCAMPSCWRSKSYQWSSRHSCQISLLGVQGWLHADPWTWLKHCRWLLNQVFSRCACFGEEAKVRCLASMVLSQHESLGS